MKFFSTTFRIWRIALFMGFVWFQSSETVFAQGNVKWVDVTNSFLKNPQFATGDKSDWEITGEAKAFGAMSYSCMEMWSGYIRLEHKQTGVPNGHYRISVQALYRTRAHQRAYERYVNGTEVISAYLFANNQQVPLQSEYSFHFDYSPGTTYTPDNKIYFPNSMQTAQVAFMAGAYQNVLDFDVIDGTITFGLYNDAELARDDNWMIFDNFKIEQQIEEHRPSKGSVCLNEVMAANVDVMMSPAYNFDGWIELYNTTNAAVTLGGCYLSDELENLKKWRLPDAFGELPAKGHKLIWLGSNDIVPMQAPFKLECEGGLICLADQQGTLVFSQTYPAAIGRTSYARTTDGKDDWSWTATPTPGTDNSKTSYATTQLAAPVISNQGGFFNTTFRIYPTRPAGTTLRYTTDGTTPTLTNGSTQSGQGISVSENTTLKFRLFQNGMLPSEVVTRTFIKKDYEHTLPVIMVSTDSRFLYDDSIGVYVRGVNGCTGNGQSTPVNWNMNWDRPVNFQYVLPTSDAAVVNQDVDFSISGGWTRSGNPKSFKLKADRVYEGQNTINYPFFAAKPYIRNKTLQVRYGGNDTYCRIKDAALHELIQRSGIDLDVMSYQPAVHYLNGEYKGLINIREPNNKDFAFANWGWSKDELEMYEQSPDSGAYMMLGSKDVLERLYELSKEASKGAVYKEICTLLDIDEYTNYMAAELFLSSWDWPDNNLKAYRKTDGGRYRITFFDLDAAFGTEGREYDEEGEVYMGGNPLRWMEGMQWHRYDYIYDTAERRYGEIKFCTFFLNMLNNKDFRRRFIDALSLMGGSVFESTRAEEILTMLGNRVRATMLRENASPDGSLNEIRNKLRGRATLMANYMQDYEPLQLAQTFTCQLSLSSNVPGVTLMLNNQTVPYSTFDGVVFLPASLSAIAPAGYRFKGWAPSVNPGWYYSHNAKYTLSESQMALTLVACFEPIADNCPPVVINEVSASNGIFVNDYFKRNDWVELYNTTNDTLSVEWMYLSDQPENPMRYAISGGSSASTKIAPHGYLVVWCDKLDPITKLHAPFKLSAEGGKLSLMAADGSWISKMAYTAHLADETVGRFPDGCDSVYVMNVPTIETANRYTSYMTGVSQSIVTGIDEMGVFESVYTIRYVAGHLIIEGGAADAALQLTIYSLSGQQVTSAGITLSGQRTEVSCSALPSGCFVAIVRDKEGRSATCKFINQ